VHARFGMGQVFERTQRKRAHGFWQGTPIEQCLNLGPGACRLHIVDVHVKRTGHNGAAFTRPQMHVIAMQVYLSERVLNDRKRHAQVHQSGNDHVASETTRRVKVEHMPAPCPLRELRTGQRRVMVVRGLRVGMSVVMVMGVRVRVARIVVPVIMRMIVRVAVIIVPVIVRMSVRVAVLIVPVAVRGRSAHGLRLIGFVAARYRPSTNSTVQFSTA
jgi:hypothetical protein